jgi:hypothetical protein
MKKALTIIAMALIVGCSTVPQPRDFSLGCVTDMECEMEDEDDMDAETYQQELDDLRYWVETGKVRT